MNIESEEDVNVKVIIYRKSRHFEEDEPIMVSEESARSSISAWTTKIDAAIEKLKCGEKVSTRNFHFYGVIQ